MGEGEGDIRTCVRMHADFRPGKVLSRWRRIHAKTRMRSFFAVIYHILSFPKADSYSSEKQIF